MCRETARCAFFRAAASVSVSVLWPASHWPRSTRQADCDWPTTCPHAALSRPPSPSPNHLTRDMERERDEKNSRIPHWLSLATPQYCVGCPADKEAHPYGERLALACLTESGLALVELESRIGYGAAQTPARYCNHEYSTVLYCSRSWSGQGESLASELPYRSEPHRRSNTDRGRDRGKGERKEKKKCFCFVFQPKAFCGDAPLAFDCICMLKPRLIAAVKLIAGEQNDLVA